jgi:hypothetical protein
MKKLKETLSSRKFLFTVAGVVTVVANDYFNLGLDRETVFAVTTSVVGYVLGQGYVDGKKALKGE